jgi:hypothetical protein
MKSKSWYFMLVAILVLGVGLVACSPEAAQQVQDAAQTAAPTIQAAKSAPTSGRRRLPPQWKRQ